ncbi:hypothetical protein N7535_007449 [Penicillium sp. DV-2018c]|nr:hypothetical protein N7535_007449 [Penicillium sp. DV-2018c]
MRLYDLLLVFIILFSPVTAIGMSCFRLVSALVGRPTHLFNKFQSEICDAGCQPTIPHWDLWTRNNSFVPAVRSLMRRMNVPHKEEALLKMGDDVALTIKENCASMLGVEYISVRTRRLWLGLAIASSAISSRLRSNIFRF